MAWAMKEKKLAPSSPQASADSRSGLPSRIKSAICFASAGVAFVGRPGVFSSEVGDGVRESIYDTSTEGPKT